MNGPGGKVERGESPDAAVVHEVAEETGLHLVAFACHGTLDLVFGVPEQTSLRVVVDTCESFAGTPSGGTEGALRWYAAEKLPFDRLWPDMRYWSPLVLAGGTVAGRCVYDQYGERLLS